VRSSQKREPPKGKRRGGSHDFKLNPEVGGGRIQAQNGVCRSLVTKSDAHETIIEGKTAKKRLEWRGRVNEKKTNWKPGRGRKTKTKKKNQKTNGRKQRSKMQNTTPLGV